MQVMLANSRYVHIVISLLQLSGHSFVLASNILNGICRCAWRTLRPVGIALYPCTTVQNL